MDAIPQRPMIATPYRTVLASLERIIVLPRVNPLYYHALGLGPSVLYLYTQTPAQQVCLIAVILIADWLDGATARQMGQCSRDGYLIDVVTDRASEALIFAAASGTLVGQVFFLLWILNVALAFYSVRSNRHRSLPLRFVFMVILFTQLYYP